MADLSPDLSVYGTLAKSQQGGLGGMSLGDLMGVVQRGRELQTQKAISDATKANPNDPMAAFGQAAQNPNAFLGPEDLARAAHAQQAQYGLNKGYVDDTWTALANLATKPGATVDDFNHIAAGLSWAGVPQPLIQGIIQSAKGPNGAIDQDKLLTLWSMYHQGQPLPTKQVKGVTGTQEVPAIAAQRPGASQQAPPPPPTTPPPSSGTAGPKVEDTAETAKQQVIAERFKPSGPPGSVTTEDPNQSQYEASVKQYAGETADAGHYKALVTPLQQMIEILRKDPNATGKGTELINDLKNAAHTAGLLKDDEVDKVVDFESFRKYAAQNVQAGSMGATDARMFETILGSPGTSLLGATNMKLAQVMLGLARRNQIALSEFNRSHLPATEYAKWRSKWEPMQDTTGFVWDQMSPSQRAAYQTAHPERKSATQSSIQAASNTRGVFQGQ